MERSTQYVSFSSRKQPANAVSERKQFTENSGDGSIKARNPETESRKGKRKQKRNSESNINDRKLKNFTLHNLVQYKENLF